MLRTNNDLGFKVKERSDTVESLRRQLDQCQGNLRELQAQYQALMEQFLEERHRAQVLAELSERFGVR